MRHQDFSKLLAGFALLLLGACQELPPSAKLTDASAKSAQAGTPIGDNQVGEACEYRPYTLRDVDLEVTRSYGVWCGVWRQPSGRIFEATQTGAGTTQLTSIASSSLWRTYLDQRNNCAPPTSTSILDGVPAVLMQCTARNGGWPHIAVAATVGGKTYLADGVPSAMPAVEAAMASLAGRPIAQGAATRSAAANLVGQRLASQPFGSGDLDRYYGLMRLGDEKNSFDDFAGAEDAFRDALAVQQKILGPTNPGLSLALMSLALQISNQQRFDEASALFARAQSLHAEVADPLVGARLDYYLAMHALNQNQLDRAASLAEKALKEYGTFIPPGTQEIFRAGMTAGAGGTARNPAVGALQPLIVDPQAEEGIRGVASVWRLQSTMAYYRGAYGEARQIADQARTLLLVSGLNPPGIVPRVVRVAALSDAGIGQPQSAQRGLRESAYLFDLVMPGEKPLAITLFLSGREAQLEGDTDLALTQFRAGAKILRERHIGLPENLINPYLEVLFREAEREPAKAAALNSEMFETAQLIQGSLTSLYIGRAAARLAAGDQKVSAALRELQQDDLALRALFSERDAETQKPQALQDATRLARLDAAIKETEARRNAAEAAAQAAAPAYQQLIQAEASSAKVIELLQEKEGFFQFQLGQKASFGFFVTRQGVTAFRIPLTLASAGETVDHLRKTAQVEVKEGGVKIPLYDVAAAYDLYEKLFGPVEAKLAGRDRLVIAGNGALLSLPFDMLVTEKTAAVTNGDYRGVPFLLKRFAISYVPAAQTFVLLRQAKSASTAPNPYIGFGDFKRPTRAQLAESFPPDRCQSDLDALTHLPDLPGTRTEILDVAKLLSVPPQDIILGDKFTRATIDKTDLLQFRVVHLATHAFLPTELRCISQPSILMSTPPQAKSAAEAFLFSDEVLQLKMDADLVILSACNTAGPGGAAGESLSGLARSFFFAGTRGLLATHWSVDDDSAEFITTHTMLSMRPGTRQDTTLALRQAKLDRLMHAGAPGGSSLVFSHPFAWAPFVLIGDGLRTAPATAEQTAPAKSSG